MNRNKKFITISSLIDAEDLASADLIDRWNGWVGLWEEGFFVFYHLINSTKLNPSYGFIAGLISEVHSSLRSSFLVILKGYYPEAFPLIRRAHESLIKALYAKKCLSDGTKVNVQKILLQTSTQGFESILKLSFKKTYTVESAYTHSDVMQTYKLIRSANNKVDIPYGPQKPTSDDFKSAANLSLFWLLVSLNVFPKIFGGMTDLAKIDEYDEVMSTLKDYFKKRPNQGLYEDFLKIERLKFEK